jgi:hypothetical protein
MRCKSAKVLAFAHAGETINVTVILANTGTAVLTAAAVRVPEWLNRTLSCAVGNQSTSATGLTSASQQALVCHGAYNATLADFEQGTTLINVTATATAGPTHLVEQPFVEVTFVQKAELSVMLNPTACSRVPATAGEGLNLCEAQRYSIHKISTTCRGCRAFGIAICGCLERFGGENVTRRHIRHTSMALPTGMELAETLRWGKPNPHQWCNTTYTG